MSADPPAVTKSDDPDHPFHLDLPWGNVGRVEVKLSAEDARALAHAILDADRHRLEARALARVEIIDVAEHARALFGEKPAAQIRPGDAPAHDYRFRDNPRPDHDRGHGTYGYNYTAADVMRSVEQDRTLKRAGL